MLGLNTFLVINDFLSQLIKGRVFFGSRVLLTVMDMIDIEGTSVMSLIWVFYLYYRLGRKMTNRTRILWLIPIVIATVFLLLNPITNNMFTIDEMNNYKRGPLLIIHWIASWIYMYGGAVIAIVTYCKTKNRLVKKNCIPLMSFIIFPAIGSLMQTFVYGISSTKLFISLGMIMVYTITTGNEVSVDALTGLNNRGELEKYIMNFVEMTKGKNLSLTMIDMNDFKKINDTLGHAVGDDALKKASDIMRQSCRCIVQRLFICRYGGDEFLIIGADVSVDDITKLETELRTIADKVNESDNLPYFLSFSIGTETMFCKSYSDFEKLMKLADSSMYEDKQKYKERKKAQAVAN